MDWNSALECCVIVWRGMGVGLGRGDSGGGGLEGGDSGGGGWRVVVGVGGGNMNAQYSECEWFRVTEQEQN